MKPIAKTLLFDDDSRVLVLTRSSSHPKFGLHFDFPGGEVEQGEEITQAASREISEECGLRIKPKQLRIVFRKKLPKREHFVLEGSIVGKQPLVTISWEHGSYQWMTINTLLDTPCPSGVDDYYLTVLEYLKQR